MTSAQTREVLALAQTRPKPSLAPLRASATAWCFCYSLAPLRASATAWRPCYSLYGPASPYLPACLNPPTHPTPQPGEYDPGPARQHLVPPAPDGAAPRLRTPSHDDRHHAEATGELPLLQPAGWATTSL